MLTKVDTHLGQGCTDRGLTQSCDAVQVVARDSLVLLLCKSEGREVKASSLTHAILSDVGHLILVASNEECRLIMYINEQYILMPPYGCDF